MLIDRTNRAIPRDMDTLGKLCRPIIRRFISQINEDRATFRSIGKKVGISHVSIYSIYKNPNKDLSRKVMIKILRTCTRKQLVKPKLKIAVPGRWNKHTI